MTSQVTRYAVDDGTVAEFELAHQAARVVIEQARRASSDEVAAKFGIKVSGRANWWVAQAATEGTFEITMAWRGGSAIENSTRP